jgi:2-polyprenyl-6-hydroxyphenyl methylase/3-demethylubiquinone-9 3-methyltransferase
MYEHLMNETNADLREIEKFEELAQRWWDPDGELRTLHAINPLRLDYIDERAGIAGKQIVDVGCGGGLLAESLAERGGRVTGIDLAETPINVARAHLGETGRHVDYRRVGTEAFAEEAAERFDIVACMELLEHVPDPAREIAAVARLARPGGSVFLSTVNRTPRAFALAVVGAEYILGMLPRGTHDYSRFFRPAELDRVCRRHGLIPRALTGITYNPLTRRFHTSRDVSVNYLAWYQRGPA